MGRRTSLASLAGQTVESVPGRSTPTLSALPVGVLAPTPLNERTNFGSDDDLRELGESIRRQQLQPIVVVSRASYLALFPEHGSAVGTATYVIINGERRWRAASAVGLPKLEVVIREGVAASAEACIDAVATENLDRKNLDPVEEARTVDRMVQVFGSARAVADHRGRHESWVSQRRSLLRLAPAVQQMVSVGDMPVRDARRLAKLVKNDGLTADQQEAWWLKQQNQAGFTAVKPGADPGLPRARDAAKARSSTAAKPAPDPVQAAVENLLAVAKGAAGAADALITYAPNEVGAIRNRLESARPA